MKYIPEGDCNGKCRKCIWTNGCVRKDAMDAIKKDTIAIKARK